MNNRQADVLHVMPNASTRTWIVIQENSDLKVEFDTKQQAERFAVSRAKYARAGQIKVHKKRAKLRLRPSIKTQKEIFRAEFLNRFVSKLLAMLLDVLVNLKRSIDEKQNSV